ncbi:hypothetical protein OKW43_000033 [Paraburkholderia sp. WC7.3g]
MNQYIIPGILAYAALVLMALAFINGAYRKDRESGFTDEHQWQERREV